MRGKKLTGIIMTISLILGIVSPTISVQAKDNSGKIEAYSYGKYYAAPPNEEKIIAMLKKTGKIDANASQEQIKKIVNEYLRAHDPSGKYNTSKVEKDLNEKIMKKLDVYGIKKDIKTSKTKGTPDLVQVTKWEGKTKVDKPLVVLIEFPNFKHTDLKPEDTSFFYKDNYPVEHYKNMLFKPGTYKGPSGQDFITMNQWYMEQSGQSYSVDGGVAGWYMAAHDYQYYGGNVKGEDANPHELVREAFENVAKDKTIDLSQYDLEDRYDYDKDGNYDEPDGVIDHLIVIHAGPDEADGGGTIGDDAIWSHRHSLGENYNLKDYQERKFAVNDYTMQPQDGSSGVFCHEFGHDLGLPDEYDTKYTGNGEPVGYWSIMSAGSNSGIIPGTEPTGFSPYAKQFLQAKMGGNWLSGNTINLENIPSGGIEYLLDQANSKGTNNDVIRINLPQKNTELFKPISGKSVYFGGCDDELSNSMVTSVDLTGKKEAKLKFNAWYDIEADYDYASIQVKEEGKDWTTVEGNITNKDNPNNANPGDGITGNSEGWQNAEFNLTAYAGKKIELMFKYQTDAATSNQGFFIDDIKVEADNQVIFEDNAELQEKFKLNGFTKHNGIKYTNQYYLLEWRNHQGVDTGLAHQKKLGGIFSYDPGLIVWYVDESYSDNWVGLHPGDGYLGVVDADQTSPMEISVTNNEAKPYVATEVQIHDAAFSLKQSNKLYLDYISTRDFYREDKNLFIHPVFDDRKNYSNVIALDAGRNIPKFGLKVYVTGESKDRSVGKIRIVKK